MNIIDKYEISSLTNFLDSFFSVQKRSQNLDKNFLTLEDNYRPYIKTLEVDNRLEIEVDLPGFSREEIVLEVVDSCLKLKSNEKLNKKSKSHDFKRSPFKLNLEISPPYDSSKISAKLTNGVLRIAIPKSDASKSKQIKID
ncbi:MAG: hypothetical protein CMI23_01060 [Opitutae bacterium]|nr:hypothetical protein [Opitutae bacterium]